MDLLTQIADKYGLGSLICTPLRLTGGFLHKMYGLFTTKGNYAVKLLNPHIMKRENAMDNFQAAEKLESILEAHAIPILPALAFQGTGSVSKPTKMQEIDGQFFYLFDWFDGKSLTVEEIQKTHCAAMGQVLARIHKLDMRKETTPQAELHIDWEAYVEKLSRSNGEIALRLKDALPLIQESQTRGNVAIKKLPPLSVICHNDMDSKNVLWQGMDYRIIDLECLSYQNPFTEMYETALCWAGYAAEAFHPELYRAFIDAYLAEGGFAPDDWEVLYDSNYHRLEWLEYNLKRALGEECDVSEIEIGKSEVLTTLSQIVYYDSIKSKILTTTIS